jgi:hypothetical protein
MSWLKRAIADRATRVAEKLSDEVHPGWRRVHRDPDRQWIATRPVKFPDMDKLLAFGDVLKVDTDVARVLVHDSSHLIRRLPGGDPQRDGGAEISRELVEQVAHRTTATHLRVLRVGGG